MDCVTPAAPFQGSVTVSNASSIAIYTCNPGFSLHWGNAEHTTIKRKCLKQGEWEGPTPFCIRKKLSFSDKFSEIVPGF
jgi:hypothetical protein